MTRLNPFHALVILALSLAVISGCDSTPEWPLQTQWRSYTHPTLGYSIDIPKDCTIQANTIFRFHGQPILCVNYVTPDEARRRGLWPGNDPMGDITLAGHKGRKYIYQHCDGLSCMNVISYVIDYRGRKLGLEFRMQGDELGDVQRHVLESFALSD